MAVTRRRLECGADGASVIQGMSSSARSSAVGGRSGRDRRGGALQDLVDRLAGLRIAPRARGSDSGLSVSFTRLRDITIS